MSARTATARARVAAESLMADQCTITRAGTGTTDDTTGNVADTPTTIYTGKCKVQQGAGQAAGRVDAGEVVTMLLGLQVHVPVVGTELVARGDIVTVTAATADSALTGRTFRVKELLLKSFGSARRLGCDEVT